MHSATQTSEAPAWAALDPEAKRERLLGAAEAVFAAEGLDAAMPAVARAAGAGVGSLYRQFASKDELVAALAERRLRTIEAWLDDALAEPVAEAFAAIERFLWRVLGDDATDDVAAAAVATAASKPAVDRARRRVRARVETLVARARERGEMREDATWRDVTTTIIAARAVRRADPRAWRRTVELALDGLATAQGRSAARGAGPPSRRGTSPSPARR